MVRASYGRAFFQRHPEGAAEHYLTTYDDGRTRGAFDGTAVIGTLRSFATDLTVPRAVDGAGLGAHRGVGRDVAPTPWRPSRHDRARPARLQGAR